MGNMKLVINIIYDYIVQGKSFEELDGLYSLNKGDSFKILSNYNLNDDSLKGKYNESRSINGRKLNKSLLNLFINERYKVESLEEYVLRKQTSQFKNSFHINNRSYWTFMSVILLFIILLALYLLILFSIDLDDARHSNELIAKIATYQLKDYDIEAQTMAHYDRMNEIELEGEIGEEECSNIEPCEFNYLGYNFMGRCIGSIPVGESIGFRDKELIVGNFSSGQLTGYGFHYTKNMSRMGYYESGRLINGAQVENYGNRIILTKVLNGLASECRLMIVKNMDDIEFIGINSMAEPIANYIDGVWLDISGEKLSEEYVGFNSYYVDGDRYYIGSDDFYFENGYFVRCDPDLLMELSISGDDFYYNSLIGYTKLLDSNNIDGARDVTGVIFELNNDNLIKCHYLTEDVEYFRDFKYVNSNIDR